MGKVIGIDIGGTAINAGVVDAKGQILKRITLNTEASKGRDIILNKVFNIISEFKKEFDIKGVGIGSPGFINADEGIVEYVVSGMVNWTGTNIKKEVEDKFSIPVIVDKDSNIAAIAEKWIGAAKDVDSYIMVTLGTGVGGAYFSTKSGMLRGKSWRAGEVGHIVLYPDGSPCGCGQSGCVEQYISGTAIERMYSERYGESLKGSEIFKRVYNSDEKSKYIVDEFIKNTSIFLVTLTNFIDPEAIIIGGGLVNSKEYWMEELVKQFKDRLSSDKYPKILPAKLSNEAGLIGAAKIAFDSIKL